jgi:hypothetical protein
MAQERIGFGLTLVGRFLVVFAGLASASMASTVGNEAETILTSMRKAAGSAALKQQTGDLLISGRSTESGSAAEFRLHFTSGDRFLEKVEGPLGETRGCNDSCCWKFDRSGVSRTLELSDRDGCELLTRIQTGQWLANVDAKNVVVAANEGDPRTAILHVHQGRLKARLYVNRSTWLPESLVWSDIAGEHAWTFRTYRDDLGWKVPATIAMTTAGKPDGSYEVSSVSRESANATNYDRVETKWDNVHFNSKSSPRLDVKRAKMGQLLVHPKIDGQSLGWFVFDTGSSATILHVAPAARVKLTSTTSAPTVTAFGTSQSSLGRATSLELGPMVIDKPFLVTMDLGMLQAALGKDVVGIVGSDLLSRCVAQINLGDNSVQLYDPQTYRLAGGRWQKLVFDSDIPVVQAKFDGGEGFFRLDVGATGAAGNVVFHSPTVADLKLLQGRKVKDVQLAMKRASQGRIGWFELGEHRFGNPNVVFALDPQGPFGDEFTAGNVGVNFLRAFRIVLDYPHERVALVSHRQARK